MEAVKIIVKELYYYIAIKDNKLNVSPQIMRFAFVAELYVANDIFECL